MEQSKIFERMVIAMKITKQKIVDFVKDHKGEIICGVACGCLAGVGFTVYKCGWKKGISTGVHGAYQMFVKECGMEYIEKKTTLFGLQGLMKAEEAQRSTIPWVKEIVSDVMEQGHEIAEIGLVAVVKTK